MERPDMTIGELAGHAGVTPKTVRYYEQVGLLPPAPRTSSGYRRYGADDVERLGFIGKAKRLGLSLEEIRGVLAIRSAGQAPCAHVVQLLDQQVERVDRTIGQLSEFGDAIRRLRSEARSRIASQGEGVCGIIEHAAMPIDTAALALPLAARRPAPAKRRA